MRQQDYMTKGMEKTRGNSRREGKMKEGIRKSGSNGNDEEQV